MFRRGPCALGWTGADGPIGHLRRPLIGREQALHMKHMGSGTVNEGCPHGADDDTLLTVSGMGVGCRIGGSGSASSLQFLFRGDAQLTCGYGKRTGKWRFDGGSPVTVGNCSSQPSGSGKTSVSKRYIK